MVLSVFNRRRLRHLTDQELVAALGNTPLKLITAEVFKRYGQLAFGVGLKYLKNKADAEDILMQTFEKLPAKMAKSDIKNLKNWLYTVCKNECFMFLRKQKPSVEINEALKNNSEADEEALQEIFIKEEKLTALEKAIMLLKNEQKTCIELFYLQRFCYEEVANKTGFELKKVKSYIQNGKRNLKMILEENEAFKS